MTSSAVNRKRTSTASIGSSSSAKRMKVLQECCAVGKMPKTALADVLDVLHRNDALSDDMDLCISTPAKRHQLLRAQRSHAEAMTPYGQVLQSMTLPFEALKTWEYNDPRAMIYYMSQISTHFSDIMYASAQRAVCTHNRRPLRVILYLDELVPGNALRHDCGRSMWGIYWALLDWPEWVLARTESWFCFGVVLTKVCSSIPGGIGSIMPYIVRAFLPDGSATSVMFKHADESIVAPLEFKGIIADLDGHAKIGSYKTIAGTIPCVNCSNVTRFVDTSATRFLVGIDCCDPSRFIPNTDTTIFDKADDLQRAHAANLNKTRLEEMSTELGINYNPKSLLLDLSMRPLYKPVSHTIRDWMHILVSDGVAGTEMAMILKNLGENGIGLERVRDFVSKFRLPRALGIESHKSDPRWFGKNFVHDHSIAAFASEQLTILPMLTVFLTDVIAPLGIMQNHIRCFVLLDELINYLRLGADSAVPHVDRIRQLIVDHNRMFALLYPDQIRPKFHHLYHIPENMKFLNKLVACFVLEQKHKATKDAARVVVRFIESCVIKDLVNRQCVHMIAPESPFRQSFLVNPHCIPGKIFEASSVACLRIGKVGRNDIVYLKDMNVGVVHRFFKPLSGDALMAQVSVYGKVSNQLLHARRLDDPIAIDADQIVAPVYWAKHADDLIRIVVPILYRESTYAR